MIKYEDYLKVPGSLSLESALSIYTRMMDSIDKCTDPEKNEFFESFLDKAIRYANIRAEWSLLTADERRDADEGRTLLHNSLISSINALSRLVGIEGLDITWRDNLGDDRKTIGDFACFTAFMAGISQR